MFFRKINNAALWDKIQKLRLYIKSIKNFRKRVCFSCQKPLNIYDFLSDNLEFTPEYILRLWQTSVLEFHCCECFKYLKMDEMKEIEEQLKTRYCTFCKNPIDLYKYTKDNSYLKIHELKDFWLSKNSFIFCNNLCQRKYYQSKKKS